MKLIFKNDSQSTLAATLSIGVNVIQLVGGGAALFAVPGAGEYFVATLGGTGPTTEIVWVTNNNTGTDQFTVIRAQEGTAQADWPPGTVIAELWTAGQCATMLQVGEEQSGTSNYSLDSGGAANAYIGVFDPPITTNVVGMALRLGMRASPDHTNTGASTFDSGAGAAPIVRRDGSALIGNEMRAGDIPELKWNGAAWVISYLAPATNAAVTAGTDQQSGVTPAQLAAATGLPPGVIMDYAGAAAPAGWLLCDHSEASRTGATAPLFAVCGIVYGPGNGTTTFNLPDYRGRVGIGKDNMGGTAAGRVTTAVSGIDGTTVGAAGGDQNMQAHSHSLPDPVDIAFRGNLGGEGSGNPIQFGAGVSPTGTTGTGASQNMPPGIVVNKIIKM